MEPRVIDINPEFDDMKYAILKNYALFIDSPDPHLGTTRRKKPIHSIFLFNLKTGKVETQKDFSERDLDSLGWVASIKSREKTNEWIVLFQKKTIMIFTMDLSQMRSLKIDVNDENPFSLWLFKEPYGNLAIVGFDFYNTRIYGIDLDDLDSGKNAGRQILGLQPEVVPVKYPEAGRARLWAKLMCGEDKRFFLIEEDPVCFFSAMFSDGKKIVESPPTARDNCYTMIEHLNKEAILVVKEDGKIFIHRTDTLEVVGEAFSLFYKKTLLSIRNIDGLHIAVACFESDTLSIINIVTRMVIREFELQRPHMSNFSEDGRYMIFHRRISKGLNSVELNDLPFIACETADYKITSYGEVFRNPTPAKPIGYLVKDDTEIDQKLVELSDEKRSEWMMIVREVKAQLSMPPESKSKSKDQLVARAKFNLMQMIALSNRKKQQFAKDVFKLIGEYTIQEKKE